MKGTILQEEISILNIYSPNAGAPIYIKKKKKKNSNDPRAQIDANTVIVGDLNTPLSPINRSSRQKANKVTSELLHTLDQIAMVDTEYFTQQLGNTYSFLQVMELSPK
jgi:hypothetical protein